MHAAVRLVDLCRRRAVAVTALFLALTVASAWFAAVNVAMDTDTDHLISAELEWKRQDVALDRAFPQFHKLTVAVIDGATPDLADDAAAALANRLGAEPEQILSVRRGDSAFLRRHGLLFQDTAALRALADRLIEAQPMIGALAADPSARGLFGALDLMLEGARRGQVELDRLAPVLDALAAAAGDAAAGRPVRLSWQALFLGGEATAMDRRRFVLIQTAGPGTAVIRAAVRELGLLPGNGVRVRLTGNRVMEEEEFASVTDGAALGATLSLALVGLLLVLALRSWRLIVPILLTLLSGLAATFAFAVAAVGVLNPLSVAFTVLFIGMGVDFGIQVATRYRDRRHAHGDPAAAMADTARTITGPLALAAATTAAGFFAFLPTDYVGVSQLGLIAGVGMGVAFAFSLTLLPALLTLFRPRPEPEPVGYPALAALDRALARHRRAVLWAALAVAVAGLAAAAQLRFDFNPLNLRDARTEAVSTAMELMADRETTPFTTQILAPDLATARALAARLDAVAEVHRALTLASFVPEDQAAKLAILDDLNLFLGPTLDPPAVRPPPATAEQRAAIAATAKGLRSLADPPPRALRLAAALEAVLAAPESRLAAFADGVAAGLPGRLETLRTALSAGPVTVDTIPAAFARDWVTADGRARIEVSPAGDARDPEVLLRFVAAVRTVAPGATGTAVTVPESAHVIVGAFRSAGLTALAAIALLLFAVLRRPGDVALVLAPLALATVATAGAMVAVGVDLNFANIVALPLLTGVGVAFAIYYVVNARAGETSPLASSTTRAVLFSALTTGVAFGSLALSSHPGTASMGILLLTGLGMNLAAVFLVLPALLATTRR